MQRGNDKRGPVHSGPAVPYPQGPPTQNFQPYPPMPMQPYSPCQPVPPMPYPPQPAACPQMPMNHPAYQPPPQLPGGYPRSPSRMNPHKAAHMQQWMEGPHMTPYSPVPSVAPSVMSDMSGVYSSRGSVMSYCSTNFDPMEGPPVDLRSPSQTSTIENIDPMQAMIPQPPQIPIANLPHIVPTWKKGYLDPPYQAMVIQHIERLFFDLRNLQKKNLKEEMDQMRRQMSDLAQLIPEIIKVLVDFNRMGVDPSRRTQYDLNCRVLLRILEYLFEDSVASQMDTVKLEVILDSFLQTKNECLLKCLDTVLDWKGPIAMTKHFRQTVRVKSLQNNFVNYLVEKLKKPTSLSYLLFHISILTNLAGPYEPMNNYLVYQSLVIQLLFTEVLAFLTKNFQEATPDRPTNNKYQCIKIFRQIVTLVRNLQGSTQIKNGTNWKPSYMRSIAVAEQLARTRGIFSIGEFFTIVFELSMFRRKSDVIVEKGIYIFKTCSEILADTRPALNDPDIIPVIEKYRSLMSGSVGPEQDWNREIVRSNVDKVMDCMRILLASDVEPGTLHNKLAQTIYEFVKHSSFLQDYYKRPEVFRQIIQWIHKFGSFRGHPSFDKNSERILDAEDTIIYLLLILLKPPPQIAVLPIAALNEIVTRELLGILFNQAVSISKLAPQQNFFYSLDLPHWKAHKNLFVRLITAIGRVVRNSEAVTAHSRIMGTIFDDFEREHLISWLFRFFVVVQDCYMQRKNDPKSSELRDGLLEIGSECLRTLTLIWLRFDPHSPVEQEVRMREKISVQARAHLERILFWMQETCSIDRHMKVSFEFCFVVCKDDPSAWSPTSKNVLMDLCQNQDTKITKIANEIYVAIQDQHPCSLFADVSHAMELEL